MPFRLLDKFARDNATVKAIFDHVRNMGIAALILAAAGWKEKTASVGGLAGVWDHVAAFLLIAAGVGLIWLNHENMSHKLRDLPGSKWLKVIFLLAYFVVFFELMKYLGQGKSGG